MNMTNVKDFTITFFCHKPCLTRVSWTLLMTVVNEHFKSRGLYTRWLLLRTWPDQSIMNTIYNSNYWTWKISKTSHSLAVVINQVWPGCHDHYLWQYLMNMTYVENFTLTGCCHRPGLTRVSWTLLMTVINEHDKSPELHTRWLLS